MKYEINHTYTQSCSKRQFLISQKKVGFPNQNPKFESKAHSTKMKWMQILRQIQFDLVTLINCPSGDSDYALKSCCLTPSGIYRPQNFIEEVQLLTTT